MDQQYVCNDDGVNCVVCVMVYVSMSACMCCGCGREMLEYHIQSVFFCVVNTPVKIIVK